MKVKIFLSLTIILFLFTGWQFSRNFTVKTQHIMAQRNIIQDETPLPPPPPAPAPTKKDLDKDFSINEGIDGGVSGGMEGGNSGGTISAAELELQKELLKAEQEKRKAEERAARNASLQLWLSFVGTIFSGITTIVLARINKK